MTDCGLDGRSSFQIPTLVGRQATFGAGDHHRSRAGIVVAAIALVDVDAVRIDAADLHRLIDLAASVWPSYGLPWNALAASTRLLKHVHDLSDEETVERWVENAY